MRILTSYLIRAHVGPFFFALSTLTAILLINTVAKRFQEMAGKGLPAQVMAEVFLLSIPHTLALTIPMAVLVAVLYAFGQLAAENEITAIKSSGVNLVRLMVPLLLTGTLLATGMVWFMDTALPETNHRLANLLIDIGRKSPTLELKEQVVNEIRTQTYQSRYFLQAAEIDSRTNDLRDVVIYDMSDGATYRTIYADSGQMAFNQQRTDLLLTLFDGWVHETPVAEPESFRRLFYDVQRVRIAGVGNQLELRDDYGYRSEREMTMEMLAEEVAEGEQELARLDAEAAKQAREALQTVLLGPAGDPAGEAARAASRFPQAPSGMAEGDTPAAPLDYEVRRVVTQLNIMKAEAQSLERRVNQRRVELHKKVAIPVACIIFVLIGVPLAVRFPRGGVGMVIAVSLAIFGIYYVGLIGGEEMGDAGVVSPFWAMWSANAVFSVAGLLALFTVGRSASTTRGGGWEDLLYSLRSGLTWPLRRLRGS